MRIDIRLHEKDPHGKYVGIKGMTANVLVIRESGDGVRINNCARMVEQMYRAATQEIVRQLRGERDDV